MYIPFNLRMHRILGRNRREPCKCGHFHTSKEVILTPVTHKMEYEVIVWALEWIADEPTE